MAGRCPKCRLRTAEVAAEVLELAHRIAPIGNPNAVSDAGVGAQLVQRLSARRASSTFASTCPTCRRTYAAARDCRGRTSSGLERQATEVGAAALAIVNGRMHAFVSAKILDGKMVASHLWRELSARVQALARCRRSAAAPGDRALRRRAGRPRSMPPALRGRRTAWASSRWRWCRRTACSSPTCRRASAPSIATPSISGIVVAQPLPAHLDTPAVLELIDPAEGRRRRRPR